MRPTITPRSEVGNSSRAQGAQRSQTRVQTCIFAMNTGEAQTDPNSVTSIMVVFDLLV